MTLIDGPASPGAITLGTVPEGGVAVTADLVGPGGYVAVLAGELDVFLVPDQGKPGRRRPLLRLAEGHIALTVAAPDLPSGWSVHAAGAAGTVLHHGRLTGLGPAGSAREWVLLLSAAARFPLDATAERASLPVRYPGAVHDFHRRALAAAVTHADREDTDYLQWLSARNAASRITLNAGRAALHAAAAGRPPGPGRPRTQAEHAVAIADLVGAAVTVPAGMLASTADPMEAALDAADVRHRAVRLEGRWWRGATVPLVAWRRDGDPVALLPRRGRYLLADPADGSRRPVSRAVAELLSDKAVQVYPDLGHVDSVSRLMRCALRGAGRSLAQLFAAGLAAASLGVAVPLLAAMMLTSGLRPSEAAAFGWYASLIAVAVAGSALFTIVRNSLIVRLEGHIQTVLEPGIWSRLLSLDMQFFRRYGTGDLVQRANGISAIRKAVGDAAVGALLGIVFSLLSLVALFLVDWRLAAILFPGAAIALAGLVWLTARQQRHELATFELYGRIYSMLYAFLLGIDKLQAAGRESQAFGRWALLFSRQRAAEATALRQRATPAAVAAGIQPLLLMVLVCGASWLDTGISARACMAAIVALGQFVLAIGQWQTAASSVFSLLPRFKRMKPLLVAEPEISPQAKPAGQLSGLVEVKSVSFAYEGTATHIFDDLSVSFEPGEFAAVVGPSGVGKSTLVRLLLGFERPRLGQVLYDGCDLRDIDLRTVRRQVGVVMQQARVLRGPILENITGAVPGITEDDAWWAAGIAGLDADIRRMPMRMNTIVSEDNGSFSGGQLQRLLIARALVKRPKLLILDEATSALDNVTQAVVSARITELKVTRIVIAHRLSTIRQADRIHVLESGRIAASGTFQELVRKNRLFAQLVRRQEA